MDSSSSASAPTPIWARVVVPLSLALLVFAVFSPALSAGFLSWDDNQNLTENESFRGFGASAWNWIFSAGHMGHYHPLTWISFALDDALDPLVAPNFEGARQFHLTNLILHAATAIAFFAFARELLAAATKQAIDSRRVLLAASFAAAFFALHPLRVESVAWVTERRDVLSGVFFALALLAWVRFARDAGAPSSSTRRRLAALALAAVAVALFVASVERGKSALAWRGLGPYGFALALIALALSTWLALDGANARFARYAVLALALSLFAKAWGIVVPALFLVLDVWPLARLDARDGRTRIRVALELALEKAPFAALAASFALLASWAQSLLAYTQPSLAEHTLVERTAQAGYGLCFYPWKTLVPTELDPLYELPMNIEFTSLRFGVPCAIALAITIAVFFARKRAPALAASWCAFALIVAPVLGFTQSGPQLVADRYSYLACLPFALLAGWALATFGAASALREKFAFAIGAAWIAVLGTLAFEQTKLWQSDDLLWPYAYALNPNGPESEKQLAFDLIKRAQRSASLKEQFDLYQRAGELLTQSGLQKSDPNLFGNLAVVHLALAKLDQSEAETHQTAAVAFAKRAVEFGAEKGFDLRDFRMNYGATLVEAKRFDEATLEFQKVIDANPKYALAWMNLGIAHARAQRLEPAYTALVKATELAPSLSKTWEQLANVCVASKKIDEAKRALGRVLELSPGNPTALAMLAALEKQ